jgi:WD40 repeat protein
VRAQPVDLIGGFYTDNTLPWACQDTLNWLPFRAEIGGTRTEWKLSTPPGLKPYLQVGAGPIRGTHDMEGSRFVVSGQTLCRINANGSVTPIGTIPGVGRVSMSHNQFAGGYQLLVENGQGGGGYVFTSSTGSFSRITDPAYPGSISSDYLDSFLLGVEPLGRYWFHSNLADANDYNSLDRYESEASPDRIVGLAVSQFEVVVFNQTTIEFFFNAGGATGTFQNRRQSIARGCASRHSIAKLDNTLFWLGDDGIVYRLEAYSARPISTGPMSRAFAGKNWAEAFAFVWEDQGFKVYYLTFPDGHTWGYDVVSGLWTRRESFGLDRWRLSDMVKWGRNWYGGDFQAGRIWQLDWDYLLEGDQEFISRRISPVMADNQSLLGIPFAELIFDTGQGPMTVAQPFPVALTITGNPPSTLVGVAYPAFSFVAGGGTAPYTFSVSKGALPAGLSLSSAGAITGTAVAGGTSTFTVRVFDSKQLWTEAEFSIVAAAQRLGLAIPSALFTGSYESLAAYAPLASLDPTLNSAFGMSPSTAFAAIGLVQTPFFKLYKLNTSVSAYAESVDMDVIPTTEVSGIAFHPDGLHLAMRYVVSGNMSVSIYKLEGGIFKRKNSTTVVTGGGSGSLVWSPDGQFLAVGTRMVAPDNGFRIFRFDPLASAFTANFSPATSQNPNAATGFGWSSDSRYIAERNNRLNVWEIVGDNSVVFRSNAASSARSSSVGAHFSQDGRFIYTCDNTTGLAAYPVSAGVIGAQIVPGVSPPFPVVTDSSFSGGYLAIGKSGGAAGSPGIFIYKCDGGSIVASPSQPQGVGTDPAPAVRWTI